MKKKFTRRLAAVLAAVTAAACLPSGLQAIGAEEKAASNEKVKISRTSVLGGGKMKMRVCSAKRCMLRQRIC